MKNAYLGTIPVLKELLDIDGGFEDEHGAPFSEFPSENLQKLLDCQSLGTAFVLRRLSDSGDFWNLRIRSAARFGDLGYQVFSREEGANGYESLVVFDAEHLEDRTFVLDKDGNPAMSLPDLEKLHSLGFGIEKAIERLQMKSVDGAISVDEDVVREFREEALSSPGSRW